MLKKLGLTLLIAGLAIGAALTQDAPGEPATDAPQMPQVLVTGGDDNALRAFILRYIIGNPLGQDVNVAIAEMPADLPFPLDVPPGATLYGTIARFNSENHQGYYEVVIDTPDSPQGVLDFYKQFLTSPEWQITSEDVSQPSPFGGQSTAYASFCYQQGLMTMTLNATNYGLDHTSVNLTVQNPGDTYACISNQGPGSDPVLALMPSLALPENVIVRSNTGGGLSYYNPMGRSLSVGAILESTRPLPDIASDYEAQLAMAGWQAVSSERSEHTALSRWSVSDEAGKTWSGTLLIVADDEPNRYNAVIYIEE